MIGDRISVPFLEGLGLGFQLPMVGRVRVRVVSRVARVRVIIILLLRLGLGSSRGLIMKV